MINIEFEHMKYQVNLSKNLIYLPFLTILISAIIIMIRTEIEINNLKDNFFNYENVFQKVNIKHINRFEYLNGREIYGDINLTYNNNNNIISIKKIHPKFNLKKSIDFSNFKFLINPDFWIIDNTVLEVVFFKSINNLIENHLSIFENFFKNNNKNSLFFRKVKIKINNSNIKYFIFNSLIVKNNRLIIKDLEIIDKKNKNTFIENLTFYFDIEKGKNKIQKINGSNIFLNFNLKDSDNFFYKIFINSKCNHNVKFEDISFKKTKGYGYSSIENYKC